MAAIQTVLTKQLPRLQRSIRKNGPLTWSGARLAMNGGSYDRRDAAFHNRDLQAWVASGELQAVELPDGDSLIGV